MKYTKRNSLIVAYWSIQILSLLFFTSGFGWITTLLAGCILFSIVVGHRTHFTSMIPIYIQFLVTILYILILFVVIACWGWKKVYILFLGIIIINLLICGINGHKIKDKTIR